MDLTLTADQRDVQDGIRRLCAGRFGMPRVRAAEATGDLDGDGWRELDDAGVFGLLAPGEPGFGMATAVVVFEELGRALVPGPLVSTAITSRWTPGPVALAMGGSLVSHLDGARSVLSLTPEAVELIDPDSLRPARRLDSVDPLTSVWLIPGALPAGEKVGDTADARLVSAQGAVLTAALLVGIAAAVQDRSVAYAREREQFGRPIGSFQAVKHLLADMLVRTELARSAVYAAAAGLDESLAGSGRAVGSAKAVAGDAAIRNAEAAVQAHGGIGFTWELDLHLYLKRAWALDQSFGTRDEHALAVADALR